MLYGRVARGITGGLLVAAILSGLGMLASTGMPRAEAAGAAEIDLPATDVPTTIVAEETSDRAALDTPAYRKSAPAPATFQPAVQIGGGTQAASTSGSAKPSSGSELAQARAILAGLIRKHPILKGTTVSIGSTPGGYQAVAYYQSGRIVINPNHRAGLSTILNHEIWHVIDWRDNGKIDWGEKVPS